MFKQTPAIGSGGKATSRQAHIESSLEGGRGLLGTLKEIGSDYATWSNTSSKDERYQKEVASHRGDVLEGGQARKCGLNSAKDSPSSALGWTEGSAGGNNIQLGKVTRKTQQESIVNKPTSWKGVF